jgi:single-strand DNA-binding protein
MNLNKAMVIGNLTRDPEIRSTTGGNSVASFSVATSFVWNDQSGQRQEKTEFHNIVAWRRLADICGQYLKKGSKVYIEGRLQTREWTGQDAIKRYRTEIVADNMIMLDRPNYQGSPSQGQSAPYQRPAAAAPAPNSNEPYFAPVNDNEPAGNPAEDEIKVEDIPF